MRGMALMVRFALLTGRAGEGASWREVVKRSPRYDACDG
jgi:hypothetical protein